MSGGKVSFYIFVILIFLGLAALVAYDWLVLAIQISLVALAGGIVLVVLFLLRHQLILSAERLRSARAQRIENEVKATTMVVTAKPGEQVYVRELQPGGVWRALHLDPRLLIEGHHSEIRQEDMARWMVYQQTHAPRVIGAAAGNGPGVAMLPEPMIDIRQAIRNIPAAIVVGSMDAGKTTLLHWIIEEYRQQARIIVLDPHASPEKWPGARVVGAGRDFRQIEQALDGLFYLMNRRYQEIAVGRVREGEHAPVVVVADEWMAINEQCHNADKLMRELLTESRKAALRFYVGSHSRRVKSLGVDRKGDLLNGVAFILLRNDGGQRWAEVETNDGEQVHRTKVILPGEYRVIEPGQQDQLADGELEGVAAEPSNDDRLILSMHADGRSYREISEARWGPGKFGSYYNEQIERVIRRWENGNEGSEFSRDNGDCLT